MPLSKPALCLPPLVLQVSIVPRGSAALGFAQYLPNENMLVTTEQVGARVLFWASWLNWLLDGVPCEGRMEPVFNDEQCLASWRCGAADRPSPARSSRLNAAC